MFHGYSQHTSFRDFNAVIQRIDQIWVQLSKRKFIDTMRKIEHYTLSNELIMLESRAKSLTVMAGVLVAGIAMAIRCNVKIGGNLVNIK